MSHRHLPRFRADATEAVRQQKIARVLSESGGDVKVTTTRATAAGDRRQLRGIPVVGGVSGTMVGTDPAQVGDRG